MQLFKFFLSQQPLNGDLVFFTVRVLTGIDDLPHPKCVFFSVHVGVLIVAPALALYKPRPITASGLVQYGQLHSY